MDLLPKDLFIHVTSLPIPVTKTVIFVLTEVPKNILDPFQSLK